MDLATLAAIFGTLQDVKDIVSLTTASTLVTILDSIGDVHASTAARLIEEGSKRSGAARRTKFVVAVGHLEVAYEAYARQEHDRFRRIRQSFRPRPYVRTFERATELALLLAAVYAVLGDATSVEERIAASRRMFDLYASAMRDTLGKGNGITNAPVTIGMITALIEGERTRLEATATEILRLHSVRAR